MEFPYKSCIDLYIPIVMTDTVCIKSKCLWGSIHRNTYSSAISETMCHISARKCRMKITVMIAIMF